MTTPAFGQQKGSPSKKAPMKSENKSKTKGANYQTRITAQIMKPSPKRKRKRKRKRKGKSPKIMKA